MARISRRDVIRGTGAALAGTLLGAPALAAPPRGAPDRTRSIRLAHFTDTHIQPESKAFEGTTKALEHMQGLADKPELLLSGGDNIMDAFGAGFERTKRQWELWNKVLADHCDLPMEHCIGNHDVWGFSKREDEPADHRAKWGKNWAMEAMGLDKPYRSFDRAGWHFIVLDSTHPAPEGGGYIAKLDDEQFDWLEKDLEATPAETNVLVLSHIPILSVAAFLDGDNAKSGNWNVPGSWMHLDARKINDLFRKHPNVRTALSGHLHLVDRSEVDGVAYLCNGAVSGAWWNGSYYDCPPGYAVVDLYDDGSVEREYVPWGWTAPVAD